LVNNEGAKNGKSAVDLADDSVEQLTKFVALLRSGEAGFASRLVPFMQSDYGGDYDHLARVAEWATADDEEGEPDE
jgi:ATP-dependent helicase/nuclease subunit B